jgi:hypothetical protein
MVPTHATENAPSSEDRQGTSAVGEIQCPSQAQWSKGACPVLARMVGQAATRESRRRSTVPRFRRRSPSHSEHWAESGPVDRGADGEGD